MSNIVKIVSKPECPYCVKAKAFLDDIGINYSCITLNPNDIDYKQQRDYYFNTYNHKSFPLIFIGDIFLGGFKELSTSYETLRLHDLCADIGISIEYDF